MELVSDELGTAAGTDREDLDEQEELLAGTYLSQASDALMACGKASALYPTQIRIGQPYVRPLVAKMSAFSKRIELARTSILFSALSAEAYANQFLVEQVKAREAKALDRLPFPDKLVLGPQVARGKTLFDRGAEPMQSIDALYRLRSMLVHPRPRKLEIKKGALFRRPGDVEYNPNEAARFLVAVATVAVQLWSGEEDRPDATATGIVKYKDDLLEFGRLTENRIPEAPKSLLPRLIRRKPPAAGDLTALPIPRTAPSPDDG